MRLRRRGLMAGLVASLAAHAVLLAALLEGPATARPGPSSRGQGSAHAAAAPATPVVYLWRAARPAAPAATRVAQAAAPAIAAASSPVRRVRTKPSRGVPDTKAAAAPAAATAATAPAPPAAPPPDNTVATAAQPEPATEVVSGDVFALPSVAFAGMGGRRRTSWRALPSDAAPPSHAVAANMPLPPPVAQAAPPAEAMREAMREAARLQLVLALTQQLAALPPPQPRPDAGRCEPDGEPPAPALRCDTLTLPQDLADGGTALAALLASYRALDARVRGAAVVWDEGRYRLDLR
ncbi:MAG: hypothetical protein HZC37_00560 [Burkholderiales bacterium]|nr:hypothetical protein [Burkholderiales bacterium]